MKNSNACIVAAAALAAGAAAGWLAKPAAPAEEETAPARETRRAAKAAPANDAALQRLRSRVAELEKLLAEAKRAAPDEEKIAPPDGAERPPENPFLRERRAPPTAAEMRAHLEELREKDPERYAQTTNRFARMRARMLNRAANRLDILASVDVSGMTDKERAVHERLQELIAKREELGEILDIQNTDATEEQRQKAFQKMRDIHDKIRKLETAERETLLKQTAAAFGLAGDDAGELVETVNAIWKATRSAGGGGRGGPPPGGHGGGRR